MKKIFVCACLAGAVSIVQAQVGADALGSVDTSGILAAGMALREMAQIPAPAATSVSCELSTEQLLREIAKKAQVGDGRTRLTKYSLKDFNFLAVRAELESKLSYERRDKEWHYKFKTMEGLEQVTKDLHLKSSIPRNAFGEDEASFLEAQLKRLADADVLRHVIARVKANGRDISYYVDIYTTDGFKLALHYFISDDCGP